MARFSESLILFFFQEQVITHRLREDKIDTPSWSTNGCISFPLVALMHMDTWPSV